MDAGHFQSRRYFATRWEPINVASQCKGCNIFRHGEQFKFAFALDKIHGQGTAQGLKERAEKGGKISTAEMQAMADELEAKVFELGEK